MPRRTKKASHRKRGAHDKNARTTLAALGATVRHLRGLVGISQDELAYQTGGRVSRQYVNALEHGTENATVSQLVHLASALNVPLAALLLPLPQWERVDAAKEDWMRRSRKRDEMEKLRKKRRRQSASPDI